MVSFAAAGTQRTVFSIRYMHMRDFENRAKFQNMNRQERRQSAGKRPSVTKRRSRLRGSRLTVPAPLSWSDVGLHSVAIGAGQWSGTASAG